MQESRPPDLSLSPRAWLELPDGQNFRLKGRCSIGRQADNDLVFESSALSRHHVLIHAGPSGHTLTDLQSSNGTYVNGELAKRRWTLCDGDEIRIGELVLRFRCTREVNLAPEVEARTRLLHDVRARECWLFVADIVGFSTLNEKLGSEAALDHLQQWIMGVHPLLEDNGARINGYLGDAIFAYWACDTASPAQVVAALRGIEAHRPHSPLPFRVVLHHGCALFTKSEKGEELTGQDVNLVFRAEKVAKRFQASAMLSQAAVATLLLDGRCPPLGESAVEGMSGVYSFFALPPDIWPAAT